jgi:hypothetical protein
MMKRTTMIERAREALRQAKWCRYYAIGEAEMLGIAGLLAEWVSAKSEGFSIGEAATFVETLRPHVPSLFQSWRPPDELEPLQSDDIAKWKNAFGEFRPQPAAPPPRKNRSQQNETTRKRGRKTVTQ